MQRLLKLQDELDILEAERLVATVRLRSELIKAATELLPEAIRQAKPRGKQPGSPALLRLIVRLAMRDVRIEKPKD
jgi:hypothetical protein